MAGTPEVSQDAHDSLAELASKHNNWSNFRDDMLRLAEHTWHNAKDRGEIASESSDQSDEAVLTNGTVDTPEQQDSGKDETPAEPQPASTTVSTPAAKAQRGQQANQASQS